MCKILDQEDVKPHQGRYCLERRDPDFADKMAQVLWHGSWLNLIEGFFSKLARSVLRHIRVASKQKLKDSLGSAVDHFNQPPRRSTGGPISWTTPPDMIRTPKTMI